MEARQTPLEGSSNNVNRIVRQWYVRWIRPHIREGIHRQRLKLLYFAWGYWPVLLIRTLAFRDRVRLVVRFLEVDWNILNAHHPCEIAVICKALAERPARPGEIMLEAGCWQGGSSAKFSVASKMLGYQLRVYDSFEGVEELPPEMKQKSYDYSGEYSASEPLVRQHLAEYGEIGVCSFHKGWFAETLATNPVTVPIRVVYIDCDLAKGTKEALAGTIHSLVSDGWVFSQDFHIAPVRELLHDPATWKQFGKSTPIIKPVCGNLASLRFSKPKE